MRDCMKLKDLQQTFSNFLYDKKGDRAAIEKIVSSTHHNRIEIYQNNLLFSAIDTMTEAYPSIMKVLGEKNFKYFVREYLFSYPSQNGNIDLLGEKFPFFLAANSQLQDLSYLEGLATIDWQWQRYHAEKFSFSVFKGHFELWSSLHHNLPVDEVQIDFDQQQTVVIDPTGQEIKIFLA